LAGEIRKLIPTQRSPIGVYPYHASLELANVKTVHILGPDGKPTPLRPLSIDETTANRYHYNNPSNPDPLGTPVLDNEKRF